MRRTQILDTRVGTRSDEDLVRRDGDDRRSGLECHVLQRPLHACTLHRVRLLGRIRHTTVDGDDHFRGCAPADHRPNRRRIEVDDLVEHGAVVAHQRAPVPNGLLPLRAAWRERTALQVVDRLVVDGHHTDPCTCLDRHVAHGHPTLHGQRSDRLPAELDGMTGTAGCADLPDDREDQVLRRHAGRQGAVDLDQHRLHLLDRQALRGHHVLDLGGPHAECERSERAVGARMGIARHDRHAGQGRALLRPDDMDDALAVVLQTELGDPELVAVLRQLVDLHARKRVGNAVRTRRRGHVMVRRRQHRLAAPRLAPGHPQSFKGLRAGHLVDQLAIDVQQRRAIRRLIDDMPVPKLFDQGPGAPVQCAGRVDPSEALLPLPGSQSVRRRMAACPGAGLHHLAGHGVADDRRHAARPTQQRFEVDARLVPHRLEHVHEILGAHVAARTGRERTPSQAAQRRVEAIDAGPKGGERVGQAHRPRVVKVGREDDVRPASLDGRAQRLHLRRIGHAGGVAQRDARDAGVVHALHELDDPRGGNLTLEGASEGGRQRRVHRGMALGQSHDPGKLFE